VQFAAFVVFFRACRIDEPSLGLAPPLVSEALGRIQQISREAGVTVLIVEQKVREVLKIAHRVYLRSSAIASSGRAGIAVVTDAHAVLHKVRSCRRKLLV
jgi:ABC-type branched-subunit amino acid transport system ATPase component